MDQHGGGPGVSAELQDMVEVAGPVPAGLCRIVVHGASLGNLQGGQRLAPAAHHVRAGGAGGIREAADPSVPLLPQVPDGHPGAEGMVRGHPLQPVGGNLDR
ncbi:hypothetical protein D9M72_559380 [compost metagenome]